MQSFLCAIVSVCQDVRIRRAVDWSSVLFPAMLSQITPVAPFANTHIVEVCVCDALASCQELHLRAVPYSGSGFAKKQGSLVDDVSIFITISILYTATLHPLARVWLYLR
jgi:hypothetical protein